MTATIDPALAEKMKSGISEINVEIEFSERPPLSQMQALGLKSEGNIAWGMLSREKIQAIATIPQVVAMRLSERAVESRKPPAQRIGPGLAMAIQMKPQERQRVLVRFQRPPKELPALGDLSVHGSSADGYLSPQEIEMLAKHDDVVTIELFPEVKLF